MSDEAMGLNLEALAFCGQIMGALFLTNPKAPEFAPLRDRLRNVDLENEWPFGHSECLRQAQRGLGAAVPIEDIGRAYQRLFIGPYHFEAPAWGSVYLDKDQVLFGTSLLELRDWMRLNGITVNKEANEPEDHVGRMLVLLGWLAQEKPNLIPEYLSGHLLPWVMRYLDLLEEHAANSFYEGLAVLTRTTLVDIAAIFEVVPMSKKLYR